MKKEIYCSYNSGPRPVEDERRMTRKSESFLSVIIQQNSQEDLNQEFELQMQAFSTLYILRSLDSRKNITFLNKQISNGTLVSH